MRFLKKKREKSRRIPACVLESIAEQHQQVLVHLEHVENELIEAALGGNVAYLFVEFLERMKRDNASLVDLEHRRIACHNERQAAQLFDEMRQPNGHLVAQVGRRLEQVRVVVRDAHVHECHGVETNYGPLDRFVDLRIGVEEAYLVEALTRLGRIVIQQFSIRFVCTTVKIKNKKLDRF